MLQNEILQGDCLTVLKTLADNSIDLGICSPPYNKGEKQKGWLVKNVLYDTASDKKDEAAYQEEQIAVLNELFRVIKAGGSFFYNHKTRWDKGIMIHPMQWLAKTDWLIRQEIIWDRMIAANIRGWRFWQTDERIYWLYKPIDKKNIGVELLSKHALLTSIWRLPPARDNPHPAPFPIEFPARVINSILNDEEGIVLDPYAGSGTTLVAAKLLHKSYLGIEISSDYIAIAKERLNNSSNEQLKINEELKKHYVAKTFKERKANGEKTGKFKPKNDNSSVSTNNEQAKLF